MKNNNDLSKSDQTISYLGKGELGGKAKGLEFIYNTLLKATSGDDHSQFEVTIPRMFVLQTSVFDAFMKDNNLYEIALSGKSDDQIALKFQKAVLPFSVLGALRTLLKEIKTPLVVRSSSLLEDAMHEPFAGIYGTKMTPNNQFNIDERFRKLIEAIKFVYASTFFKTARDYIKATSNQSVDEKMSVIIQEVIGKKFDNCFFPEISGVIKSYNYYPSSTSFPEDGVVNLALGLGKQIVDGGISWSFNPKTPSKSPPFNSIDDQLKQTQTKFWSINLDKLPTYDPIKEEEFLIEKSMYRVEKTGILKHLVSTYDPNSNRIWDGQVGKGARILNFSPVLKHETIELNELIKKLMIVCEDAYKCPVEIEFAVSLAKTPGEKHKFGFLQVRPMVVSDDSIDIDEKELERDKLLLSKHVLGNGQVGDLEDIVFLKRKTFDANSAYEIASQLEKINAQILNAGKKYVLIGFGRWGTSDPWAGIPVNWSQISAAKVIIETSIEGMSQQMSQASHFFHNVSSFQVFYFSVPANSENLINWKWLENQKVLNETEHICHICSPSPLEVKVDGRQGLGVIFND